MKQELTDKQIVDEPDWEVDFCIKMYKDFDECTITSIESNNPTTLILHAIVEAFLVKCKTTPIHEEVNTRCLIRQVIDCIKEVDRLCQDTVGVTKGRNHVFVSNVPSLEPVTVLHRGKPSMIGVVLDRCKTGMNIVTEFGYNPVYCTTDSFDSLGLALLEVIGSSMFDVHESLDYYVASSHIVHYKSDNMREAVKFIHKLVIAYNRYKDLTWNTKEGDSLRIRDMSYSHLKNVEIFLNAKKTVRNSSEYIVQMKKEAAKFFMGLHDNKFDGVDFTAKESRQIMKTIRSHRVKHY